MAPSSLAVNERRPVAKGESYSGVRVLGRRNGHAQVELPDGGGSWWILESCVEDIDLGLLLPVPYFLQRVDRHDSDPGCFSSVCVMALMTLRPLVVGSDEDYIEQVFCYGNSDEPQAQIKTLKHFGVDAELCDNASESELRALLDDGVPVPCEIFRHGPPGALAAQGRWVCVIGYIDDPLMPGGGQFIFHDPVGQLSDAGDELIAPNGNELSCSYELMKVRRTAVNSAIGRHLKLHRPAA
jgi:hypothetical protein